MAEDTQQRYELRRQSRGGPEPARRVNWRRRAWTGGAVLLVLVLAGTAAIVWYRLTRVHTVSARVAATTVALAPTVDARLTVLPVSTGDTVQRGQVLARLDATELLASLETAEATRRIRSGRFAEAEARLRRVQAEIAGAIQGASAAVQIAEAHVGEADAALRAQRVGVQEGVRVARARRNESRARLEVLKAGPREEEIRASQARLEAAEALHALYEMELEQSRELAEEGIDSQHMLEVRRTRVVTQGKAVEEARLQLQQLQAGPLASEVTAAEQALAATEAEVGLTAAGSNEVAVAAAQLAVREAELNAAQARREEVEAQRAAIAIAEAELDAARAELEQAEAEVAGRRAVLDNRDLISPVDGVVVRTFVRVGEVCRKGETCLLVADNSKPRWIEGYVREEDAMKLVPGQPARVRAPARSGADVDAVLEQVGLHTTSSETGSAAVQGTGMGRPERVWVRLRPLKVLHGELITGTSAHAVIRVR